MKPLTFSSRTLVWCLCSGALALFAVLVVAAGLERSKGDPHVVLDNDARRRSALENLLRESQPLWTVNDPRRLDRHAVAFFVVASTSRRGTSSGASGDVVNAAYDRRRDAVYVTSGFAQLLVDFPDNERIRNFATLIILHELGHRDSALHGGPLPKVVDEERQADAFAIGRYLSSSGKDLTALVEDIWNLAEGEVLGIFTQYGPYDPVTDYTTHGGFLARIVNLYQAILATPGLAPRDAMFVSKLAAQANRFAENAKSFQTLLALPPGRIAVFAILCGNNVRLIDHPGDLYDVPMNKLSAAIRNRTHLSVGPPLMILDQSGQPLELRSATCDVHGHLVALTQDGGLFVEKETLEGSLRLRKIWDAGVPDDWTVANETAIVTSIEDGRANETRIALDREPADGGATSVVRPPDCKEDCTLEGVRLQTDGCGLVFLLRLADGTLRIRCGSATDVRASAGAAADVGRRPGEVVLVERTPDGFRSGLFDSQTRTSIPFTGLSQSTAAPRDLTLKAAFDIDRGIGCYGVSLRGQFIALVDPASAHPRFLDSYMSAADVLIALGGREFLVSIPYSRFLVVARC